MVRNFLNLSSKECLDIYQELIDNSNRHFLIALKIAENKEFGIAISHLILGTEELVKGIIIFLDGNGLEIRKVQGIKNFFKNHIIRHYFSGSFSLIASILIPFTNFMETLKEKINFPDNYPVKSDFELAILNNDKMKIKELSNNYVHENIEKYKDRFSSYLDFWSNAETKKQRGFYVDYENQLYLPKQISETEYSIALQITNSFRQDCTDLIKYVSSLSIIEKQSISKEINSLNAFYNIFEVFTTLDYNSKI